MKNRIIVGGIAALSVVSMTMVSAPAKADAVADYYKGKAISLFIGFGAGGGYDTYARIFSRHFGKHVPGNPTIVPKNMPGAGGLKAANFLANAAPQDGSSIGMFAASIALEPLFGNPKAKFKTLQFNWIGNINRDIFACGVWKTTGVKKFSDMLTKPVIFGASGPGAITSQHPMVMKNVLGANVRVILGYKGTKGINLAMQKGEVNATCGLTESSTRSRWGQDVENGDLKVIIQFGREKVPYFGDAARVYDLAKSESEKQIFDIIFRQGELGRPIIGTPGIPAERVAALRTAFNATMKDPEFLATTGKAKLAVDSMTAEQVVELLKSFQAMPKSVVAAARKAVSRQ